MIRERPVERQKGRVSVVSHAELACCSYWRTAFAGKRKDSRYYEVVEDTIRQGFEYRYFVIEDDQGAIGAIQPFFLVDQDLVLGSGPRARALAGAIRRLWPRFLSMRMLMVGCVAGEGHLDGDQSSLSASARRLAGAIATYARDLGASMIVLKEFPAQYREPLRCFLDHGFSRLPSLPMTILCINYQGFDDYMKRALNSATRRKLRKKFKAAAESSPIDMTVVDDISPIVDDVYALYLQVYQRSKLHFEKLTKDFFCRLGVLMPDKVRFFLWRQNNRLVAFTLCMIEGDAIYAEYIGLDYAIALQLHLYHYAVRDMISWAIANRYKWFRSSGLNYDPKLHLRHRLDPIDLYVRHVSPVGNLALKLILPLIAPTRYDRTLKKFPNYDELWGKP